MSKRRLWSESGLLDVQAASWTWAKIALLRGLRCMAIFSSLMRLLIRVPVMLFLLFKSTGGLNARKVKIMFMAFAYPSKVINSRLSLL